MWSLTRADHAIALFVGVLIGAVIVAPSLDLIPKLALVLAALSPALQWMGVTSANDLWDYETDKANRRTDRPLVTGKATKATASTTAFVTITLSVVTAWLASHLTGNYLILLVASLYGILGVLYSYRIKAWPLAGNAVVALGMALPYPYGNLVVSQSIAGAALAAAGAAFCFGIGRELIKSIMDAQGDKKTGRKTLPILVGTKASSALAVVFMAAAIVFLLMPFFALTKYEGDYIFLAIAIVAAILALKIIFDTALLRNYRQNRHMTLFASFIALIAFLAGALV